MKNLIFTFIARFLVLTILFMLCGSAYSATYYVATNGNDSYTTTQAQNPATPWLTIQKAANSVSAGDNVLVQPGNYSGTITVAQSGTSGSPILITSSTPLGAVLTGQFSISASYVTIDGFSITNGGSSDGFSINGGSYVTVRNNYISYAGSGANFNGNYITVLNNHMYHCGYGVFANGSNYVVEGNLIERLYRYGGDDADYVRFWGTNGVFRNNIMQGTIIGNSSSTSEVWVNDSYGDSHVDCFQTWALTTGDPDVHNITFEGNYCTDSYEGIIARETTHTGKMSDFLIRNNVFYDNGNTVLLFEGVANTNIYNNTVIAQVTRTLVGYLVWYYPYATGDVKNNIFYDAQSNLAGWQIKQESGASFTQGKNLFYGFVPSKLDPTDITGSNPLFVNYAAKNFHLQSTSPCVNAGANLSGIVTNDKDGISRPQGSAWDIGCFEYVSGGGDTQAPSVPSGLASSNITGTSFTLSWTASTDNVGVTGYEVFKNAASIGTSASASMSVTGLTGATTYTMTVRAKDAVPNWSAQSTALNVTTSDTQAPSVPSGLASSNITSTNFTLSWTASTDNVGVTGYEVFKNGVSIGTSASASMSVTGLAASTTYTMTVRAKDAVPNWSAQSTALNVTTSAASSSYTVLTTQTPTGTAGDGPFELGMKFQSSQAGQITKIRFYKVSGETAGTHTGRLWSSSGTQLASIAFSGETSSGWQEATLSTPYSISAGTTYVVSVNASTSATKYGATPSGLASVITNGPLSSVADGANGVYGTVGAFPTSSFNNGNYFRDVVFVPPGGDTQTPSVPTGLASSSITGTSFTLSWTASTDNVGVTGYEVFKNAASIGTNATTSMSVTGLTGSTTYTMTVRAKDAVPNWSAQSTALNVTTSDTQAPSVPAGLASSNITQTSFTLSWTASTDNVGVTGYEVFKNAVSIGTSASASMSVTGLTASTTYTMTVRARDAIPNWSAQSTALNVTTQIINETFTTSPASNFTPNGGTWTVTGGQYVLTSPIDGAGGSGNPNKSIHSTNLTGDWTLTVDASVTATTGAWDDFSVIFGYQDANNYYYVSYNESNDALTSGLFKFAAGVETQLADITSLIAGGTTYAVKITKVGSTYSAYRNTVLMASATDATWSNGKVGFGSQNNGAVYDNLIVVQGLAKAQTESFDIANKNGQQLAPPSTYELLQNYPNPFNPSTNFEYRIANSGFVSLKIFDVLGREAATLVNEHKSIGIYTVQWDASNLPSGVYFSRLTVQSQEGMPIVMTKKVLFTK